jgi:hypothetical protein
MASFSLSVGGSFLRAFYDFKHLLLNQDQQLQPE